MNLTKFKFFAFLLLSVCPLTKGQTASNVNPEVDRLVLAYTFYLKQKISMDFISGRFPELQENIILATNEWNREFKYSIERIDSVLTASLNDKWEKEKATLIYKFSRADNSTVTLDDAKKYIYTVSERASGKVQTPILEIYLTNNPLYREYPEKEFIDGYVKMISVKEFRPNANLNLRIAYPKSWKETVYKKGNLILKCINEYGLGPLSMALTIEQSRNEYTNDAVLKLLTQDALKKGMPANGIILSYTPGLAIHNCPAASVTYYYKVQPDNKTSVITESYILYYKNFKVSISFSMSSSFTEVEVIKSNFYKFQKLFDKITENVVILAQWGL